MGYEVPDSSGTDDDLPPSHQNRVSRGRITSNGRSVVGSAPYSRALIDMEAEIHKLEQEAYCSVLRAFQAQSDAITWEKEGLITELRKELRVSDDEHRELLTRVNADDIIRRIRDWRQAGGHQAARFSNSQPVHDLLPSPNVSASRKKYKTSQSEGQAFHGLSSVRSAQYPSAGPPLSRQLSHRGSSVGHLANEADPLVGRKVWTRWPDDNKFYEAVIADYNPTEGRHALVYDRNLPSETWEWVDFKEIPPDDIRWDRQDPGISYQVGHAVQGRGIREPLSRSGPISGTGRGRVPANDQFRKESVPPQNGMRKNTSDDIELLNTETLVKEVEKVFDASHPDPDELEKAKKMLKEHEQALIDAIARLAEASDGESDGQQPLAHGQAMDWA